MYADSWIEQIQELLNASDLPASRCFRSSDPANAARAVLEPPSPRVPPGRLPVKAGSCIFAAAS
jgi:hypothetical protein